MGKPVVIEKLNLRQRKAALAEESRRYSGTLSSFSYGKVKDYFPSLGHREGVEVYQVNPAFSSVIGRVRFTERYGSASTRRRPWCWPGDCLAAPRASPAVGCVPWATAYTPPPSYLQGSRRSTFGRSEARFQAS